MTKHALLTLALGEAGARKVDYAIPQPVFDGLTPAERENIAGWSYIDAGCFGRLLTMTEVWQAITARLDAGELSAHLADISVGHLRDAWPCFRAHVMRGEIRLTVNALTTTEGR